MTTHPNRLKKIWIEPKILALCFVKASRADALTREEISGLMNWCDCQNDSLWEGLTLQEILNVYRVSAEWETWQSWSEDERDAALLAWNRAVSPKNRRSAR